MLESRRERESCGFPLFCFRFPLLGKNKLLSLQQNREIMAKRKYPVGIQTFSQIVQDGYVYIDKTDLVWELVHYAKYVFLSRPRRFGKSLLTSTLESYFCGEKPLFEGLKIMNLEKEWKSYPVIRLDLSMVKGQETVADLQARLLSVLKPYTLIYGRDEDEVTPGGLLAGLIRRAWEQTGEQVAIVVDEYDAPLLDVLHDSKLLDEARRVMQEFYVPLKASEAMVKFCFITGITRLSQLNIFSTLNNLTNVSLLPAFSTICGITEEELYGLLHADVLELAQEYECTEDEMKSRLKVRYDGYHFSRNSVGVYNPYSLFSAFVNKTIANYWFETGTPTFLIRMMRQFGFDITNMDNVETTDYAINRSTEAMTTMIPLLYQTGYLTISGYDKEADIYTLSIPNQEVRVGYADGLLPAYVGLEGENVQTGFALKFWRALKAGDVDLAMHEMQRFLEGVPYVEGFKKKLAEAAVAEGFYEYTMYLIFSMLNVYARTQVKCVRGRIDMVVWMPDTVYVFELKTKETAQKTLEQIDDKSYAIPYQADGRRVVKVGVKFNVETRVPEDWVICE